MAVASVGSSKTDDVRNARLTQFYFPVLIDVYILHSTADSIAT
jgi:hypothetical protein